MRSNFRFTIFAALVCLCAITTVYSQDKPLKINFPEVEGWEKSAITTYPYAELGYSINYESEEGGKVTIYVYNGGRKKIPNDAKDNVIKGEIDKAKNEILTFEKMGRYKNVKELKDETIMLGGEKGKIECQHKLFSLTAGRDDLLSEIFLFGYQNHFIKLRATRLYEKDGTKNKSMTDILTALDKLFSDGDSVVFQP